MKTNISESYEANAEAFIRSEIAAGRDPRDIFDDWRNQYSMTCDGVELHSAWSNALNSLEQEGVIQL